MDPGTRLLGEFRTFPPLPHVGPAVGSCGWTRLAPQAGEPSRAMQEQGNTLRRTGLFLSLQTVSSWSGVSRNSQITSWL
ncbi:hypothetical protein KIL84_003090 [Mauremys mutica]|uniref:Uncharacterized protein n=1 Tax=Mauremys mutica TaxID=74926 RepID=A0A9D4AMM2_9SAUR|nr:hypothetical protein KIL84_003090 [Mauremys mutica]